MDFTKLDPRFKLTKTAAGGVVIQLSNASATGGAGAGAAAGAGAGAGKAHGGGRHAAKAARMAEQKAKAAKGEGAGAEKSKPKGEKKLTKKELRILKREQEAAAKAQAASDGGDKFGVLPRIQSTEMTGRTWLRLEKFDLSLVGKTVLTRARVASVRAAGKASFIVLRQGFRTLQCALFKDDHVTTAMLKFVAAIPPESYVDITGVVSAAPSPITGCSQRDVELQVRSVHIVSKALNARPFDLESASNPIPDGVVEDSRGVEDETTEVDPRTVSQFIRLNNRVFDLRTPANQAIMRISSTVCTLYREFLLKNDFVEMQTPKLVAGTSEGGAAVFRLKYFGQDACLAQSPQLYKQMVSACSDYERCFEVGPVFRAEDANTHRHLCEFHGLDMEMVINEHYYEALDVFSDLFIFMFDQLNERCAGEIEAVRAQYPFEDLQYHRPTFRITFAEGIKLLQEAGHDVDPLGDLDTPSEKALGKIVKEKYGTDFYFMDKYPLGARPFYTMPCPDNPQLTNSYDFFIRGEEILSGAQRIHEPELLAERATEHGIPVDTIKSYIDSFRHGAYPHAGGGVGLERVVMLFLGLGNIRKCTMFTRDPRRLAP